MIKDAVKNEKKGRKIFCYKCVREKKDIYLIYSTWDN